MKNYRPVSNLPFISKIVEKIVASQLEEHMTKQNLHEITQSAYKKCHSTETALVKVSSDILSSLDQGYVVVLVMLDLSAVFETIDHEILLQRFENTFGITNDALSWFRSYLADRYQIINIDGVLSDPVALHFGVPQGSVLGPKEYTMYTKPLGDIIKEHGLQHHFYADDSQSYLAFKPVTSAETSDVLSRVEMCLADTRKWMRVNMLKVNDDKTEVMLFTSKHKQNVMGPIELMVGDTLVQSAPFARNLGVKLDANMVMDKHINATCTSAYFQLRKIRHIRRSLTENAAKTLVHTLVTPRIDYCNVVLYGLPKRQLQKIQQVQNTAARIVTKTPRRNHITPVLRELHWLPVEYRIQFKLLVHTYRALNAQAPIYITDLLQWHKPARSLKSEQALLLNIPRTRTATYGERAFQAAAPTLWNKLPSLVKSNTTLDGFKKDLKTFLFERAFDMS